MGVLRVRTGQDEFALLDSSLKGRLLGSVELAVVVFVIGGNAGVHVCNVVDHHFRAGLLTMGWRMDGELQFSISDGLGECLLLGCVQFAVFVGVKCRNAGEELAQMLHERGGVQVFMRRTIVRRVTVLDLRDGESAHGQANGTADC